VSEKKRGGGENQTTKNKKNVLRISHGVKSKLYRFVGSGVKRRRSSKGGICCKSESNKVVGITMTTGVGNLELK